jgi:hypothetical protein
VPAQKWVGFFLYGDTSPTRKAHALLVQDLVGIATIFVTDGHAIHKGEYRTNEFLFRGRRNKLQPHWIKGKALDLKNLINKEGFWCFGTSTFAKF